MANKDQLLAYPIVEEIDYRSKIDSKKLNEMLRSIEESVLRSIMRSSELEQQMNRLNLGIVSAYTSLARSNQIYNSYPEPYDIPSGFYGGVCFSTGYGDVTNGRQNKNAGIITLSWDDNKKISKIPIYEDTLSPNVEIYVDDVYRPQTDPVYNILDGDDTTFWIETMASGVHTIEVRLPPSVKRTFNYVEANPFPVFGMNITKIEYYDLQSVATTIYDSSSSFYNSSTPIVLHLSPKEFNNTIKFTVECLDGINTVGFSKIDICSIDYTDNITTCYFKFENVPTGNDHADNPIDSISPVAINLDFFVDGIIDNNYDKFISEISLVTNPTTDDGKVILQRKPGRQLINTTTISVDQDPAVDTVTSDNALYLKVVMNEVNLTTPMFKGAKLDYREVL
jgi:hypothetical protein